MKTIKNYILESTQGEDLQEEVGLALRPFGNVKNGFKMTPIKDIKDAMYKLGFDYDDSNSDDQGEQLTFVGDYINSKYEVDLYYKDHITDKVKLTNFNVFEL